jgi:pimeloyl-ACP methyl ester carboxylesterase
MRPLNPQRIIYLHGLESNSQTHKAAVIRRSYPAMLVPDFTGDLKQRMGQLGPILGGNSDWTIIGSSFGGLMGALFTCQHPGQVRKLVLLAPALMLPEFARNLPPAIEVPTVLIQGANDTIIEPGLVVGLAEKVFARLTTHIVEDDHRLHSTADSLNWHSILG